MKASLSILKYFTYKHLPAHLQLVSKPFCEIAEAINANYMENEVDIAEAVAGLRKLLEAKDCIVRSVF